MREKGYGSELLKLLEITQENRIEVDAIIGDSAYTEKENLKLTCGQNINMIAKLNPLITPGSRKEEDRFQ